METAIRVIEHESRSDSFRVFPLGDVHVGHSGCREDTFADYVAKIAADPHAYWVGMGDYLDAIQLGDKRSDIADIAPWVTVVDLVDIVAAQRDRFLGLTEPIWPKCLGLLTGNHEDMIRLRYERDVFREIVGAIRPHVPWAPDKATGEVKLSLGYAAILRISFRRNPGGKQRFGDVNSLDFWLHHGAGGGRLKGAKALNLQRASWAFDVDAVIAGHTHDEIGEPVHRVGMSSKGRLYNRRVAALVSGTFLETWTETGARYIERAGYWPGGVGTGHLEITPSRGERDVGPRDTWRQIRIVL